VAVSELRSERRLREGIRVAGAAAVVGIALSASGGSSVGGWLLSASVLGLAYCLHRFGRLGPPRPI
jgi:hypothetical protein